MRVLVTGAGGFLGGHLVMALVRRGYRVIAASSQPAEVLTGRWQGLDGKIHTAQIEFLSSTGLSDSLPGIGHVDAVINCAFPRNLGGGQLASGLDFQAELFRAIGHSEVGVLINVSSQSVYDSKRVVAAGEDSPLDLDTPYATAKYATEVLANELCQSVDVVHARMASLIGPEFSQRVVNKMTARALDGKELTVQGGTQAFGYMDVRDAAAALVAVVDGALSADNSDGVGVETVNVGIDGAWTLKDIAATVADVVSDEAGIEVKVTVTASDAPPVSSALDVSKLADTYGFRQRIPFERTVRDICQSLA